MSYTKIRGHLRQLTFLLFLILCFQIFQIFHINLAQANQFGSDGYDGQSGRDGWSGSSGQDQLVFLQGNLLRFSVSGSDGQRAEPGGNGVDASGCYFYGEPSYNVYGARGGHGGSGGDGGYGGHGGNLTVYLNGHSLDELKMIDFVAYGGRGGEGAPGGYGGRGCSCPRYSWSVRECHYDSRDYGPGDHHRRHEDRREACTFQTYYCSNGSDGHHGSYGGTGSNGSLGHLTVIDRTQVLPTDRPSQSFALSQLPEKEIELTQHQWIQHSQGARDLLAPGSVLQDHFTEYSHTLRRLFVLEWQSPRAVEGFSQTVGLSLQANKIASTFPASLWMDTEEKTEGDKTTLTIKNLVTKEEAENVHLGDIQGKGKDLTLEILDQGEVSDYVATNFRVTYEAKRLVLYKTFFSGEIPRELVTKKGHTFVIALGQLKIPSKYLANGKDVKISVTIKRSFAGHEAEWRVSKKYEI